MDEERPELKECPFCGGVAQYSSDGGVKDWRAWCISCGAMIKIHGFDSTPEMVAERWNRRNPYGRIEKIMDRIEKDVEGKE